MKNCKDKKTGKHKKQEDEEKKKCNPNPYSEGELPPCSDYLGNPYPLIINGKYIFKNDNRIYAFITTDTSKGNPDEVFAEQVETNIQITLTTLVIGLYINEIQRGIVEYDKSKPIHSNKAIDDQIHEVLQNPPTINDEAQMYSIKLSLTNQNAIESLLSYQLNITPLNYYILFALTRIHPMPDLYFVNNAYVDPLPINFSLAAQALTCSGPK